ncbi:DUF922 domain-containing protein [Pontibacter ruber]|uniref:DUF922 domain-containing protein n=1 Tax=Pontibacter ruber TaxID=1343895 RepID=A0ABW5CQA9_9BACT|nr:DUF922 domain-containing protein [Pontibacter ruber]
MFFFTLFLSLLTGLFSPAAAPAVIATKLAPAKTEDRTNNDKLAWSPARKLSWEDFKGNPDDQNPHHALTAANLAVDAKCNNNKFMYEVKCVFLPQESWSKNKMSKKLLQHEQLHFDLTEVHARLLRQKLVGIGTSCASVKKGMQQEVNAAFAAWKAEQDLFDKKSNHGLDSVAQQQWAANIEQRLQQLEAWK